jgi:hypothetical protein
VWSILLPGEDILERGSVGNSLTWGGYSGTGLCGRFSYLGRIFWNGAACRRSQTSSWDKACSISRQKRTAFPNSLQRQSQDGIFRSYLKKNLHIKKLSLSTWGLAIYAPMMYKAPYVMFMMRADPLRRQLGGGWALEIETFLGPVKWHRAVRRVPFGDQKGKFPRPSPLPIAQVTDLPAPKTLRTGPNKS